MIGSHLYRVGYWSCEEAPHADLWHFRKMTKEELTEMVEEASLKAIQFHKAQKHHYVNHWDDIFEKVIEILKDEYGFSDVKIEASWHCFGWASMFREGDWKNHRSIPDELSGVIKKVRAAGYTAKDDSLLRMQMDIAKEIAEDGMK